MKNIILILIVCSIKLTNAQNTNLSLEVSYPLLVDKNFIANNYNGTVDLGIAYRFFDLEKFKLGLSVNTGFYSDNDNESNGLDEVDVTIFAFQPRAFIEFFLEEDSKFRPRIGMGYTSLRFKVNDLPPNLAGEIEDSDTRRGFNFNLGMAFYFTPKFFGQLQYDFVKLSSNSDTTGSAYNENVNILKIGVGYQF